jgi:hypothetical protein
VRVIALLAGLSAFLVLSQDATAADRGTVTVPSPRAGGGVTASLLGTTRRADGSL